MRLATCPHMHLHIKLATNQVGHQPSPHLLSSLNFPSPALRFAAMVMEESWPSMWSSVRDWFSPTVLFVLLNLVIGTIALTSKTLHSHRHRDDDDHPRPISRGPSAVLDRLRSIGLYRFRSGDFPLDAAPPSPKSEPPAAPDARGPSTVLERLRSFGLYRFRSGDLPLDSGPPSPKSELREAPDASSGGEQHHFSRCQSDSQEAPGEEKEKKLAGRMKKSASENSAFAHFEEAEIVRRPAAARCHGRAVLVEEEEGEVDARATAFINGFKQQLKLQRLDSDLRYTEMLNRGK